MDSTICYLRKALRLDGLSQKKCATMLLKVIEWEALETSVGVGSRLCLASSVYLHI